MELWGKKEQDVASVYHLCNLYNEETDEFNVDLINKFYNDFINNVKSVHAVFKCAWVDPRKISLRLNLKWKWSSVEERINMGYEILNHGMYFPLVVFKTENGYIIQDGNHRLDAVFTMMDMNKWPKGRKIFVIIMPECCKDQKKKILNKEHLGYPLPEIKYLHLVKNVKSLFSYLELKNEETIDDDIIRVGVKTYVEYSKLFMAYQIILERVLEECKIKNNDILIQPSPFINNQIIWKKWKENHDN